MSALFDTGQGSGLGTPEDICGIYVRLLTMGWAHPALVSDRMMAYYGERLGHYVRKARLEREAREYLVSRHRQYVADVLSWYGYGSVN